MLVHERLQRISLRHPDKTALICCGRRLSYRDVDEMAGRLANALVQNGVARGDRVCILLPNGIEAVIGIFAALKAGAAFVPIHYGVKSEKIDYILSDCEATALITDHKVLQHGATSFLCRSGISLKALVVTGPAPELSWENGQSMRFDQIQESCSALPPAPRCIDLDLACIVYTSGTTGKPKGVMCDHSGMLFAADSVIQYLESSSDDVVLNVLPIAFSYGLFQVITTFLSGGTLILETTFAYPVVLLQRIARERVTGFPAIPTIFASLLEMDFNPSAFSTLRYMTNAAAALPVCHIQELRARLPWVKFYSMYGQTETKRTLYLPPEQVDKRPGSVGIAIPGTEVWIEDESGAPLGPHQVGELIVRGRHLMRGYWRTPQETAERLRPGPVSGECTFRSGDLFRMDEDGYFYFIARKDDMIKSRGEKVAPREVETVLHSYPGVTEAAVFGVPDPVLGEALKAVLVADAARVTRSRILAHCRAHLEDFMVPKYIEFREELPKTGSGKILKRALL
jgi:long-chain acyl-CoA synthetase